MNRIFYGFIHADKRLWYRFSREVDSTVYVTNVAHIMRGPLEEIMEEAKTYVQKYGRVARPMNSWSISARLETLAKKYA